MKYLKVIVGLGLIPLGVLVGSFISLGGGSAVIFGGIVGVILCCMLFWSSFGAKGSLSRGFKSNTSSEVPDARIEQTTQSARGWYDLDYRGRGRN